MAPKSGFKLKRPRFIHFAIALLLALLIMDRGAAWLYRPQADSKEIILYTTTWCSYCESLRLLLKAYGIPYKERDVEKSLAGAAGWWALRARGVPVSVIGGEVVYGYDLPKIDEALRQLGYTIQEPEEEILTTESTGKSGADVTAQAAVADANCEPAEEFDAFYARFKTDDQFRIQRTRFPLRKRLLSGSPPYRTTDEVAEIEKNQVLAKEELVYLDHEILEVGDYSQNIYKEIEESRVEITGTESPEPITVHKFRNVSGCWFFVEYESYEYFGSMMILSSL
jgi:mycoredoxin